MERLLGYSRKEWVGQPESIFSVPEERESWETEREAAQIDGSAESARWYVKRDGTRFQADAALTALYDTVGELIGYSRTLWDIAERQRLETAVREGENRFRLAAEAAQIGTWDYKPQTGDLRWDNRCCAAFGLPDSHPVTYSTFLDGIHPDDRAMADAAVQRALSGDNGGEYDIEFRTVGLQDGGRLRWVAARGRAFFNSAGTAECFIGTLIDITGRREVEETLRERDERYRIVTRATRDAIWDWDLSTDAVWWNEGVLSLFGYEPGQVGATAEWWSAQIHPDDRASVLQKIHAVIDNTEGDGHTWTGEYRFRCADGTYAAILDRGYMIRDASGNALRMIGAMQDVTERRRAEEALREREEFLRRVVENSPDCIKTMDLQGHILSINDGGQQLLEIDDFSTVCGADWQTFWQDDTCSDIREALDTARAGGTGRFQGFCPTVKGNPRWWDVAVVAILGQDGTPEQLLGVSRDITEQKQAAEQIAESEQRFTALFERATVGITLTDLTGRFVLSNDRYCQIVGRTREELIGLTLQDITHPEDRDRSELLFAHLLETGEEIAIDKRLVRPDGSDLWVGSSLSLIRRKADEPLNVQVVSIDLTERKQVEAVRERLQQRERNIATQLQEALIPPDAPNLPGLSLSSFYRSALEEAGVGGDFFDVFTIEKGCTALVVGDLSGKGLTAASQVAIVRNMLRYAVYAGSTLVAAISTLNRILAEQDLLTGFATLFVGAYDQAERTLTYVNCGQEPGLLWRKATGEIEELSPSGPVLGGFQDGTFQERVVHLNGGDVLTLFTDGLTEVGPTRKRFLEVEGVSDLLRHCCAADAEQAEEGRRPGIGAKSIRDSLIHGVDAFARDGIRDDIALLVGIVEDSDRVV